MRFCESSPVQVPVAIFELTLDPSGAIGMMSASAAFAQLLQLPAANESQLPNLFLDLIHPDDRGALEETLRSAAQHAMAGCWEGRLQTESSLKSVRLELHAPKGGDRKRIWTGIIQDLTDIKALQERFENVLEAAQAYTWRRDLRLGLSQFGVRWGRFSGHAGDESAMQSTEWLAMVHPDDQAEIRAAVEALERGEVAHQTLLYRRRLQDGSWVWLRVHAGISERDGDGRPIALSGVSFDVTAEIEEQRRFQREQIGLRKQLDDTRSELARTAYDLTENIPIGTYTMVLNPGDELAKFRFMSRRFLEITGLTADEARADPLRAFECVHPDHRDDWIEKNINAFVNRIPFSEETRLLVNGQESWVIATSRPRLKPDGTWIWEGVIQDITEQKLAEIALQEANLKLVKSEALRARLQERQQILQDIHDGFGNKLAVARLQLSREAIAASDAARIIDDCVSDLRLIFSSLDTVESNISNVLNRLIVQIDKRIRRLPVILSADIDLPLDARMEPRALLQLSRILQEAISNSLQHADASLILFKARIEDSTIWISIQDDGRGFKLEQKSSGRGLENMNMRALQLGAELLIDPSDSGTCVKLKIPLM